MTDHRARGAKLARIVGVVVGAGLPAGWAQATDIYGLMPAALDQPQINAVVRYPAPDSDPLYVDIFGSRAFNITAFLDTGASGILLSNNTAGFLGDLYNPGVPTATANGKTVIFQDVGVAGSDNFRVSVPITVSIAPFTDATNAQIAAAEDQFSNSNPPSFQNVDLSAYQHTTGVKTQIGPFNSADPNDPGDNPLLGDLDVFGMPVMKGKVVVMDPRPVENAIYGNIDNGYQMQTRVYTKGAPIPAGDPGIPRTTRTIKLSYGSFGKFTQTGTLESNGTVQPFTSDADIQTYQPTLDHNPFIGPNPIDPTGDSTPPITVGYNGKAANGSFLLDTGAAASMISTHLAGQLNVRYRPGTQGTDNPILETFNPADPNATGTSLPDQFNLSIGGIGGTTLVSGFFLDSMLVKTKEGNAANDNDPKHFRFMGSPVLVTDITLKDPKTNQPLTLDGIFGMNTLVASLFVSDNGTGFPDLGALTPGAFDAVVFDEPSGELRLRPRLTGDADRDGIVGFADLLTLARNYNKDVTSDPWANADFNFDGKVDFFDLLSLAKHYNKLDAFDDVIDLPHYDLDIGLGATPASVPEPAAGLALTGGALLLARRRRRRRAD